MNSYISNTCCAQSWACDCPNTNNPLMDNPEASFYDENNVNCEKPINNSYCSYQQQLPPSPPIVPRGFYNSFPNVANSLAATNSLAAGQLYANPAYAPCQTVSPWNYSLCYGYYGQHQPPNPCQFTQFIDIEDFMSNEKRKEKSRDAARCRRSRETEIFNELGEVLPLKKEDVDQLDKASVMRLAIALLKARNMLEMFPHIKSVTEKEEVGEDTPPATPDPKEDNIAKQFFGDNQEACNVLMESLDGFLMILANDGDITYVTENIKDYLGISKIDVLGNQIWDYCHQCDHDELKEALNLKKNKHSSTQIKEEVEETEELKTVHRDMFIRLKCTLTSRGRSVNIKSASYKVIRVTGHLVINTGSDKRVLIAVARPIPHPSNIEIPLGTSTFLTKHSLDMKFTYVDDKMLSLLGYNADDLMGQSVYDSHHGGDSDSLHSTFKTVLNKGQGETCRYRFLGKSGGYCWIVTQATVVYDKQKPQSVVCVNYVIRGLTYQPTNYYLDLYVGGEVSRYCTHRTTAVTETHCCPV